jgi:exosortase/archaeosortase family protein
VLTAAIPDRAAKFAARSVVAGLLLFGVLRVGWVEANVLLPLTRLQGTAAEGLFGTGDALIAVTLACSGAEALAACLAATYAYPATWRMRLAGAVGGVGLIALLNTLRIGMLGRATASPAWFDFLHVYLWPAGLTLTLVGYVFTWMAFADRRTTQPGVATTATSPHGVRRTGVSSRFVVLTVVLLVLFTATSAFHLRNPDLLYVAGAIAHVTALALGVLGVSAHAIANVLWTVNGGFLVTPECVVTPLIAIYLAAVFAYSPTWPRVALGVVATLPLFAALAVVRLLVVALPASIGPLFFVHAFYQLLLAALAVGIAARWRHQGARAAIYAFAGVAAGVLFLWLPGPLYSRLITQMARPPAHDPQAALMLLPSFQVTLYLALMIAASVARRWRPVLAGLAALGLTQVAGLSALRLLHDYADVTLHVSGVRAWAVAAPILIFLVVVTRGGATR